jgi:hypothetical protein
MITTIKATELDNEALWKVFDLFSDDTHLTTLIGAVIYAGKFSLKESNGRTHFHLVCPNSRTAKELSGRAVFLFAKLNAVFPISRLVISTVSNPCQGVIPFDECRSLGTYIIPPDLNIGVACFSKHPDWFLLQALDDDNLAIR